MNKYFVGVCKFIIITLFLIPSLLVYSSSNNIDNIKQQIFYLKQKIKENKTKLYYQNLRKKDIEEQLNKTWRQINEIEYNILVTEKRKKEIQSKIKNLSSQIEHIKLKINTMNNILESKLILFLKYDLDFLSIIFSAKSLDIVLDSWYILKETIKEDLKLINQLDIQKQKLYIKNIELINLSKELKAIETKLAKEKKYYLSILDKRQKLLKDYQAEIEKTKQNIEYYESIQKEKYEELQRYIISNTSRTRVYRSGRFLWPTTSSVITSYYGYRVHPIWGTTRFHSGIDIGAPYGAPIYSAADGVVIFAGWYYGYGNTVVIDHGSGISTLYAHCSSIKVYKGQTVVRGQAIAFVGSTGNSTGPHLHFEILINGKPVNPLNYL